MIAGAVAMGAALYFDPMLAFTPGYAEMMYSLAVGGLAMEAGAIANALTSNRATNITTRQPASYRQIIYGEQRVGGIMVYESTTGSKLDQYNMIIVLATHEIDSIVNLYLDGRRVHWDGSNTNGNVTRNGVNFGGNASGGQFIGPGGQNYNFDGLVYCEARFGDQANGDVISGMTANDPHWASTSAGAPYLGGCAYVYLKVEYDTSMFASMPEIKFTVNGKNNIIDPRLTPATPATPPTVLALPSTLTNGWAGNAQDAAYEEGVDQGYGWGLNSDATSGYSNPNDAYDGNLSTASSVSFRGTHQYAGCIWSFPALTGAPPANLWLNVNSMVNPYTFTGRSAGIWFSTDGGTSWQQIYNSPNHAQLWDCVELSPTQDTSQVQVMAFTDAHDDMAHFVYEIQLATAQQVNPTTSGGIYTINWALIIADVLTDPIWGLGDTGSVNQDQLIAAANVCDEQIALADGGSEAAYTCNFHYDTGTSPGDVLQTMMPAAAGRLSRIGGEWFIWPGYWTGPTFAFDESVLTGKVDWKPYRKFRELVNCVNGTYIAPNYPYNVAGDLYDSNGWYDGTIQNNFPYAFQPTNYPQYAVDVLHGYASNVYLNQDGGIVLPKEVSQQCVLSVTQAQRCAKIILLRNRQQGSGTLMMHLNAWQMQPIDTFYMTFAPQGWSDKVLEVVSTKFTLEDKQGEATTVRFECGVQETDPSVYAWSTSEELSVYDVPANPQVGPSYIVPPPSGLLLESDNSTALISIDGVVTPQILATWTPPGDSTVTQINIQYQLVGATSWINAPSVSGDSTSAYISGVINGQSYNVQIQSQRSNGATSVWVEATDVLVVAPISSSSDLLIDGQMNIIFDGLGDTITVTGV